MTWLRGIATVIGILVLIVIGMQFLTRSGEAVFSLPPGRIATEAEKELFIAFHQRYSKIVDAAYVSGDVSEYPSIFINDPGFDMSEGVDTCLSVVDTYDQQVEDIITSSNHPHQVAETGILSCWIASGLHSHESVVAWAAVRATASAEGRAPHPDDLPDGLQPVEKPHLAGIYPPPYIVDATINGDYATVEYAFDGSGGGWHEHMLLRQLDGQWYIAGIWSSGSP